MFTCFILLLKVIEILLVYTFNFGIKLCPKLPKYLTYDTDQVYMVTRIGFFWTKFESHNDFHIRNLPPGSFH